jgi:hypothetical protein
MDIEDIKRLAAHGIASFSPTQLPEASPWLLDYAEASGDARYASLAESMKMVSDTFEAQSEQMLTETVNQLDALLAARLPEILESQDAASASMLARDLREQVAGVLGDGVQKD